MKVTTKYGFDLRKDSVTSLDTAGVLGETYLDIDSSQAIGATVGDGDTLPTQVHPDFNEVVRSSQSTLQNMDALLKRADRILAFAESGKEMLHHLRPVVRVLGGGIGTVALRLAHLVTEPAEQMRDVLVDQRIGVARAQHRGIGLTAFLGAALLGPHRLFAGRPRPGGPHFGTRRPPPPPGRRVPPRSRPSRWGRTGGPPASTARWASFDSA